jgi:hypothetical protein
MAQFNPNNNINVENIEIIEPNEKLIDVLKTVIQQNEMIIKQNGLIIEKVMNPVLHLKKK